MAIYFLKLCWKNVWRNRRRTLLTVTAIGLGVAALVLLRNYYDSFHEQVIKNVIRYQSGHLVVSAPGFEKHQSASLFLKDTTPVFDWLSRRSDVSGWSERVLVQGLISSPHGSANIAYVGIDPEKEKRLTRFSENVVAGSYFGTDTDKPIVLGKTLSQLLEVEVGSKVVALSQGIDGSIGNELFHVVGIFESKSDADRSLAFIPTVGARTLLSLPGNSAHQVAVLLSDDQNIAGLKHDFEAAFVGSPVQIKSWMEVQRHITAMVELDRALNRLLLFIILFVAALGAVNSILMGLMERVREFGVMMAVGTSRIAISSMAAVETILLAGTGILFGNVLGVGLTLLFYRTGFDLKWLTSHDFFVDGTIVETISHPWPRLGNSLVISGAILAISSLFSLFPARYLARLRPIQALKAN